MKYYKPELDDPVGLIESLPRRKEQRPQMRHYEKGYESWMGAIPIIEDHMHLSLKKNITHSVMQDLAAYLLAKDPAWLKKEREKFERSILAIEKREGSEGAEILVAHWPKGFTSPVHGHAPGYLFEQVLDGRILVNLYRYMYTEGNQKIVRPISSGIQSFPDILASDYVPPSSSGDRIGYVHSFTALTPVTTIHFLPEHTRDSRDNTVTIEHFDDFTSDDVVRLNYFNADAMNIGDVALVRSQKVTEYGDHFIVITGPTIEKPHGYRKQDTVIQANGNVTTFLDGYVPDKDGLTLLWFKEAAKKRFLNFHEIKVDGNTVTFPKS
jgi:hypothetical protein